MSVADAVWEERLARLWSDIDRYAESDFVARIDAHVGELPPGSAIGLFERGAALDSTGHADGAVPLYEAALEAGLEGERRRRAVIQMASSLRTLGNPQRSLELLRAEAAATSDALDGAVAAFMSLALADLGQERQAVAIALAALSRYLPRYTGSVARYALEFVETRQ